MVHAYLNDKQGEVVWAALVDSQLRDLLGDVPEREPLRSELVDEVLNVLF